MMGPYLAVILDSFHSALSSRVLWIAFIAIWILLAALAPIGFREDFTTTFRVRDFENGTRLKAMLASSLADPRSQPLAVSKIAQATPDELKRQLERVGQGDEVRVHLQVLADAFNALLDRDDWYEESAWQGTVRLRERRELEGLPLAELDESQQRRLSRLRIEAALPGVFVSRSSRSVLLTYAGLDFPASFAIDINQFTVLINQFVIPTIINWLLGFVVIFLGILVTSSIVPDMLQPGSLHLLLSKPVTRTGLLLSKFLGGCVFVFLCVTQLVIGLWLICGTRLDVWNPRMLWCIPVCVFLFAVYYSVSVVAGLRWQSSILAIGVTCIFGAICLVVGVIGGLFDSLVTGPARIQQMAVPGKHLIASTSGGGLARYEPKTNQWSEIFESDALGGDRMLAPIAINDNAFVSAKVRGGRFNPFGSGSLDLMLVSEANNWEPIPSLRLPTGTIELHRLGEDRLLAVSAGGLAVTSIERVLKDAGEPMDEPDSANDQTNPSAIDVPGWISKLTGMMGGATDGFESILPPRISLAPPRRIAVAPSGDAIFVAGGGRVYRLVPNRQGGLWEIAGEFELEGEISRPVFMAASDRHLVVARSKEPLKILDAASLEPLSQIELDEGFSPISVVSLGNSSWFALQQSDGSCSVLQHRDSTSTTPAQAWQVTEPFRSNSIEAIHFEPATNQLWVAHDVDRIEVWNDVISTLSEAPAPAADIAIRPSLARWRLVDRYLIAPLRFVVPQTGELGETIAAIVSGESSVSIGGGPSDEPQIIRYRIVRPVVSCASFIFVMLTIGCVYFGTRDF